MPGEVTRSNRSPRHCSRGHWELVNMILCERKINIEKDMLLKDKNQSKRTIKMDLNNFDKTLLRDVIGKKENNENLTYFTKNC